MLLKSDHRNVRRNYESTFQLVSLKNKPFLLPLPHHAGAKPCLDHVGSQYPRGDGATEKFPILSWKTATLPALNHIILDVTFEGNELVFCLSQWYIGCFHAAKSNRHVYPSTFISCILPTWLENLGGLQQCRFYGNLSETASGCQKSDPRCQN